MLIENDKDEMNTNFNDHTNPSQTTGGVIFKADIQDLESNSSISGLQKK
jgi:hypothetical protein